MKKANYKKADNGIVEVYCIDEEDGSERKCYMIDKVKKEIICYIDEDYFVDKIYLSGFTTIPEEFSELGYIPSGVQNALNTAFKDINVKKFTISKEEKKGYRKAGDGYNVTIPYTEFAKYKKEMIAINTESKRERRKATNYFLAQLFPQYFEIEDDSINRKKNQFISGLDVNIIPKLSPKELLRLQEFVYSMLDNKYIDIIKKLGMISEYKTHVDTLIVDEAIKKFEENMKKDVSENMWGQYIQQYLFLLETKYIKVIPELNLKTCTWRKVDFAYIDYQGDIDLFEIKKPTTPPLYKNTDRGNYYWHTETVKAITQAEKYLFESERKEPVLSEDIKRENNEDVEVIKPKVFLVIGSSEQLDKNNMKEDFRILRESLKNVNIILYDELYERFKYLKKGLSELNT